MGAEYEAHTPDGDDWTLNCGFRNSETQSASACWAARNALWSVGAPAAVVGVFVSVRLVGIQGKVAGGVVKPEEAGGVVALTEEIGRERASAAAFDRPGR